MDRCAKCHGKLYKLCIVCGRTEKLLEAKKALLKRFEKTHPIGLSTTEAILDEFILEVTKP